MVLLVLVKPLVGFWRCAHDKFTNLYPLERQTYAAPLS